ncbi:hypothetical protein EW146_g2147 [Bondarzewia mesenterica]|uniref:Uncharacterized protein n=1 Tax=Bondarzewia mesenterica TaxID=1095465 RepID=A0A4S4M7T8_9AGAM|nr:hypothetical protein EW146_g2147 [Bondarzewia mesenterica]
MSAQVLAPVQSQTAPRATYEFLAHPPQKKRPVQPLPPRPATPTSPATRCRSHTTSAISAWAALVQPGSPAPASPPCSVRRPSLYSLNRRSSLSRSRRPSTSTHVPPTSFLSLNSPSVTTPPIIASPVITPSINNWKPDLVALGYAYAFVALPNTPAMASPRFGVYTQTQKEALAKLVIPSFPVSPDKRSPKKSSLRRLRSLTVLKSTTRFRRSKSTTVPISPARSPMGKKVKTKGQGSATRPRSNNSCDGSTALTSARRKKAKNGCHPLAVPFQNKIALMQFADGGSAGGEYQSDAGTRSQDSREERVWRDEDEECEHAHLLGGEGALDLSARDDASPTCTDKSEERHGSILSQDSDLDSWYAIAAPETEKSTETPAASSSALAPAATGASDLSVLAHARSQRPAPHPRNADASAFMLPRSPRSESSPPIRSMPVGKARRRPAPLTLPPAAPQTKCPTNSPVDQQSATFFSDSFAPAPAPVPAPVRQLAAVREETKAGRSVAEKPSRLNLAVGGGVKGFLRAIGGGKKD